jgi:hypothetical protein
MPPRVVVARSYHIKPLLAAAQDYVDALLLHFNESGASLYRVNPVTEHLVDSYLPTDVIPKNDWPAKLERSAVREFLEFLLGEVTGSAQATTKLFGVTGSSYSELQNEGLWGGTRLPVMLFTDPFRTHVPQNAFSILRLRLSRMIHEAHTARVARAAAGSTNLGELSVETLGRKILSQEVTKLCVSLDNVIFGEFDSRTGEVVIHRAQQNAIDDDILDDLVELALDRGIDVSVVPKKHLPRGKLFVAS